MGDIREHSENQRGIIEKIISIVPGYGGYIDREFRRECDKLLRDHLAVRLEECKKDLHSLIGYLTDAGRIPEIKYVQRIEPKLERIINRVKFADHGYSAFFGTVKVLEEELDKLYKFDMWLAEDIKVIKETVKGLNSLVDDPDALSRMTVELMDTIEVFDEKMTSRDELLSGLK